MCADQIGRAPHRLGAQLLAQLTDHLGAQQRNLLSALNLDSFDLDVGLDAKLLGDAFGIDTGLLGDVLGLRLGFFHPLGMILVGVGQPLGGLRALVQLVAHRVLLRGHQAAHRRHDVPPDDPDDDQEADELSDEG